MCGILTGGCGCVLAAAITANPLNAMNPLTSKICALLLGAAASVSCSTTYDAYGRPVDSVDPATATLGIAAAGIAGYAIGNDRSRRYEQPYYGRPSYYGGPRYDGRNYYRSPYAGARPYGGSYYRGSYTRAPYYY